MKLNNTMVMGLAVAAALSFGCNRPESSKTDMNSPAGAGKAAGSTAANENKALTLTGCLQKTEGITGDYILAQATSGNSSAPIGTSGSSESGAAVGERQLRAAEHSYRLSGESDQLKDLVGHTITVSGTLADRGDLAEGKKTEDKDANSGRNLDTSDLAKVNVTSVQEVSANCSNPASGKSNEKPGSYPKR